MNKYDEPQFPASLTINGTLNLTYCNKEISCLQCKENKKCIHGKAELEASRQRGAQWRHLYTTHRDNYEINLYECTNCGHKVPTGITPPWENYCPNCGAKMRRWP